MMRDTAKQKDSEWIKFWEDTRRRAPNDVFRLPLMPGQLKRHFAALGHELKADEATCIAILVGHCFLGMRACEILGIPPEFLSGDRRLPGGDLGYLFSEYTAKINEAMDRALNDSPTFKKPGKSG